MKSHPARGLITIGLPRHRTWCSSRARAAAIVFVSLAILLPPGHGQAAKKPGEALGGPVIDKQADALLRKMGETLRQARAYKFHAEIVFDDVLPSGQKIQYAGAMEAFVRRPDRLYVAYKDDLSAREFWLDGKSATLLDVNRGLYAAVGAAPRIDTALDRLASTYALTLPLAHLASDKPYKAMMEHVRYGIDLGTHDVQGVPCRHLAFVQRNADWQIWIEEKGQVVPRKIVVTYKNHPGAPQYAAVFTAWDLRAKFTAGQFKPVLPKGAQRIEFIKLKEARR